MRQSRLMSLVEALANVAVGYGVAVLTQMLVFPLFGLRTTVRENLAIGAIFTVVSLARSYVLRRAFEAMRGARRPCLFARARSTAAAAVGPWLAGPNRRAPGCCLDDRRAEPAIDSLSPRSTAKRVAPSRDWVARISAEARVRLIASLQNFRQSTSLLHRQPV